MTASSATITLEAIAAKLREAPKALTRAMPELRRTFDEYLTECFARGVDPDGQAWPKTKAGKTPELSGSQRDVTVKGHTIIVRMRWYDALHSRGIAKGGVMRRLIPAGGIPPELAKRFDRVIGDALRDALE